MLLAFGLVAYTTAAAAAHMIGPQLPAVAALVGAIAGATAFAVLALIRTPRGVDGLRAVILTLKGTSPPQ